MIELYTPHLIVRDHVPSDLADMHRLLSEPEAMYYLDDIRTETLEQTRANLDAALSENCRPNRIKYFFAVIDRATGGYLGEVGYTVRLRTPQGAVCGLGYFLLRDAWGRGVATEAAGAVLRFAFERGGIVKVETGCIRDNAASEAVMKKLGMTREADFRLHVWHDGRLKDRVEYGMTREDWTSLAKPV